MARGFFAPLLKHGIYQGFAVIGPGDIVLASGRDADVGSATSLQQPLMLAQAWGGRSLLTLPQTVDAPLQAHRDEQTVDAPPLFAVAPVRASSGSVTALLALRLNPAHSLHKTLQAGMTGSSGESYLFDRDGVLLSESRFTESMWADGRLPAGKPSFRNLDLSPPGGHGLTRLAAAATAGRDGVDVDGYTGLLRNDVVDELVIRLALAGPARPRCGGGDRSR